MNQEEIIITVIEILVALLLTFIGYRLFKAK